jgi:hypothetical protein
MVGGVVVSKGCGAALWMDDGVGRHDGAAANVLGISRSLCGILQSVLILAISLAYVDQVGTFR